MNRLLGVALTAATMLATPAFAEISYQTTTCSYSADAAIAILGANGEMDGVEAEYRWLEAHRPGFARQRQSLVRGADGRMFDLIAIAKGKTRQTICFDITGFHGKF